jgi:hypothetical protein
MVKPWDFAGDLTGIRDFETVSMDGAYAGKLDALSGRFGNHVMTYEPEINHVKQVVTESNPELHAHEFHGEHTYSVLEINPNHKTITVLSSLKGQEPVTMPYSELGAADPDGVINSIRVR